MNCPLDGGAYAATAVYLDQIGVKPDQVSAIVASHWHDDHVKGIADLANKYPTAEFSLSAVFDDNEAAAFLAAYSGYAADRLTRGTAELAQVLASRTTTYALKNRSVILETTASGRDVRVTSLSPVDSAFAKMRAHFASYIPGAGAAINRAPAALSPNMEAVVIHVDLGDDAILLGSDLEDDATLGWTALLSDGWAGKRRKSSAFKVAHHGSISGHCDGTWKNLLEALPTASITPFINGGLRLPTDEDVKRIKSHSGSSFITSGTSKRSPMDSKQVQRLKDICKEVSVLNAGFGAVRLRKKKGDASWKHELFGTAIAL